MANYVIRTETGKHVPSWALNLAEALEDMGAALGMRLTIEAPDGPSKKYMMAKRMDRRNPTWFVYDIPIYGTKAVAAPRTRV
jgi:hypothetical protein